MDPQFSESAAHAVAGWPQKQWDRTMASALRRLDARLGAATCTAYLLTSDARSLVAAMTVSTPLSFTILPSMAADDVSLASARAHQSGGLVFIDSTEVRSSARQAPAVLLHIPFATVLASAPVRTPRRRFGAVTLRWTPARKISAESLEYVQAVADELAADLEKLAEQGAAVELPLVPRFVSRSPGTAPHRLTATVPEAAAQDQREEPADGLLASNTYYYQLHRLAFELAAAGRVRDIVAAAQAHVRPLGARGLMLSLAEKGRLHVVGAAGFPREAVHQIEGTLLSEHTPETDTITQAEAKLFPTVGEFRKAYPDAGLPPDFQGRAYLPLVSGAGAVGCCTLDLDTPGSTLTSEELAVLVIMLEQVGLSLERARSYEIEHALTQSLQRTLLPRSLPHLPEVVATSRYLPANEGAEVGGDWYDILRLPEGGIGLVIGDVQGHSLEAAGTMGQLRSATRAYAAEGHDPARVLERSNHLLAGLDTDLYATCCCLWLDLALGSAGLATAGHPGPLISDAQGRTAQVQPPMGPPLGVDPHAVYEQSETLLSPGSVVALFTDGLLDTRRLGVDAAVGRLACVLAENCTKNLETLADCLTQHCTPRPPQADDVALLVMRYEGAQPGGQRRVAGTLVQRHDLRGVAHVRHFLRELLGQWDLMPLLDNLELLATEVVTNALIHAHSDVDLRLREYPDRLRVEVRDSDPHPPVPTEILTAGETDNQEAESGRGLLIVDALAADWGSSPAGRGKTTWFELTTT
ncbi:SpoIIE family protein phosphatase [Streptomyces coffeae]|uniref:SpoIIE family protein phosphatase n=1 Tax=Streptomyces coffeae TaxID=621382 RepID=A0ABS1NPF5_9ACTN|nr:SpoIIE family protein phosphatase [Streptomyces coffeae]MBL1101819.1 SpoIIE family protein phosphatase [Streptomyces coffeae]